jgi:hypothetical protein
LSWKLLMQSSNMCWMDLQGLNFHWRASCCLELSDGDW